MKCQNLIPYPFLAIICKKAGASLVQELAYTLADGKEYAKKAIEKGLDIDAFCWAIIILLRNRDELFYGGQQNCELHGFFGTEL